MTLDETVIQLEEQWFRRCAAVDSATNDVSRVRLNSRPRTTITEVFLGELRGNSPVEDATFPVDGPS